jgi:gluconolactonase
MVAGDPSARQGPSALTTVVMLGGLLFIVLAGHGATAAPATASQARDPAAPSPVSATTLASLIAPGAQVETFASDMGFVEGPLWLPDGRLIVSEVYGNVVSVFDATGRKSDFRRPSNKANGHALAPDGSVIQAESGDGTSPGRITRLAPNGQDTVLADRFQGKRFNSPNDLIVKRDGTIWFTDPDYGAVHPTDLEFRGVYRLDPSTGVVTLLTDALNEPNGIAFSPDEKTLYVSDVASTDAFPVNDDGTIEPGHPFGPGADGIGVDEQGNVWGTSGGAKIYVTDPQGIEIGTVSVPGATTNLAWGGEDGKTLYVTTDGGVYSLALTVRESH